MSDEYTVDELIAKFAKVDYSVCKDAVMALTQIGNSAVEALIIALSHENAMVRRYAAITLGNIGDKRAFQPLLDVLHQDNLYFVREEAAEALCKFGDGSVIKLILNSLPGPGAGPFWNELGLESAKIAESFVKIGEAAVEPLIRELEQTETSWLRECVVKALGEIRDTRAIEPLINTIRWDRHGLSSHAASALGNFGKEALNPLLERLKSQNRSVRRYVVIALGNIGDVSAAERLFDFLQLERDEDARNETILALGKCGDKRAVELIVDLLQQSKATRLDLNTAAKILGNLGDERAVPPLIALLDHHYRFVDHAAAEALEKIGTPEALAAVAAWRKSQNQ